MGLGGGTVSNCLGTLQTLVATRTDVGYASYDFTTLRPPLRPLVSRPVHTDLGIKSSPVRQLMT